MTVLATFKADGKTGDEMCSESSSAGIPPADKGKKRRIEGNIA